MNVSYKKLWILLIERDMKRKDLLKASGISAGTMAKLTKGENVTTGVLKKICETLGCNISDIMEFVPKSDGEE